ncbi:ditrans,polycis-polyprenyl diphosphate synthase [Balamuthia mandrillaris]
MQGLLSQITSFDRSALAPTTTVVRHATAITGETTALGFDDEEQKEFRDTEEDVKKKAAMLSEWIVQSRCAVVYTGAGISTAADVPDYRGGQGIWTLRDKGYEPLVDIDLASKQPTASHRLITLLHQQGYVKYLISTNTDNLHRRSGFPPAALAELHGNCFIERCDNCSKTFVRPQRVSQVRGDHLTGNYCEEKSCCSKRFPLRDTVVGFGENLPIRALADAEKWSEEADLTIVLGSSMRVRPSCEMPAKCVRTGAGKMVIVNLQKTPYDEEATLRIGADIDEVMKQVANNMNDTLTN